MVSQQSGPLLEVRGLTKRFPGVLALDGVTFDLRPGEIHALCGENGAGKSTLIKTLSGVHPVGSYEGDFRLDGAPTTFKTTADAERAGIAVIFQELTLVREMTVAENIFLGSEPRRGPFVNWEKLYHQARELIDLHGLPLDPTAPVKTLGIGQQQMVEILKALSKKSRILILDEPTAALTEQEADVLLEILRKLRARGIACIYISHKLEEVLAVADRITVLRDGRCVADFPAAGAERREIIRHMVGREIRDLFPRRPATPGKMVLRVENLEISPAKGAPPRLSEITFEARTGEVLGLGGLLGAGRTELLLHVFGAWGYRNSGSVNLNGDTLPDRMTPIEAVTRGMVLVSEDRRGQGLVFGHGIGFNLSLSSLRQVTTRGLIDRHREYVRNRDIFQSLAVKAPHLEARVDGLSGGNQQKVVIGKALLASPEIVFLDEPTRGVDVGAKVEIYELINQLTDAGKAVILVSSELPELMGMSDRILMIHEGRITGEFNRGEASPEALLAAAMGQRET